MSGYTGRYGLEAGEVDGLYARWRHYVQQDCVWATFDDFLLWVSESEFSKGMQLRKRNESKPHSPNNSYWRRKNKDVIRHNRELGEERKETVSPFCEKCEGKCANARVGCLAWRMYFVQNWNENICRKPKEPERQPGATQCFRYEHPDLVREGIVFEMRTD